MFKFNQPIMSRVIIGMSMVFANLAFSSDMSVQAIKNSNFAIDYYKYLQTEKPDSNVVFSPISISTAFAMTYAGAAGNTQDQMADVMHFSANKEETHMAMSEIVDNLKANKTENGYDLSIVNRVFLQNDYEVLPQFSRTLEDYYQSGFERIDFKENPEKARLHINQWVENQTNQKIVDLIPQDEIKNETRAVLTNAVYFLAEWETPFKKIFTEEGPFLTLDNCNNVATYMQRTGSMPYYFNAHLDAHMVKVPFKNSDLSMMLIVPKTVSSLEKITSELSVSHIFTRAFMYKKVVLKMPKFKTKANIELSESLKNMGMKDAFDRNDADFSNMTDDASGLYIRKAFHQVFIDVNEDGTEAAAATAVVMDTKSAMFDPEIPVFVEANHPFVYAIVDDKTQSVLFLGSFIQPKLMK